eukprot:scaffold246337_cov35-Tisochrysis_lutea.AAC.5
MTSSTPTFSSTPATRRFCQRNRYAGASIVPAIEWPAPLALATAPLPLAHSTISTRAVARRNTQVQACALALVGRAQCIMLSRVTSAASNLAGINCKQGDGLESPKNTLPYAQARAASIQQLR